MRNWLIVLLIALPCALSAQFTQVPDSQCVYRLGDNPAWAAVNIDENGWKPYTEYRTTGDAWVLWVRCRASFDTNGIQHPALMATSDGPEQGELFVDGQRESELDAANSPVKIYPIAPDLARATRIVAVRVVRPFIAPGLAPGRPAYLNFGDAAYMQSFVAALIAEALKSSVPTYSSYLVICTAGLFLLGLYLFDRSQKGAFWLGLYCSTVCIPRLNVMGHYLFFQNYPHFLQALFFGLSMFESWALVRVNFALAQRRVPILYWLVFAAWVFIFAGSVLPAILPAQWALPLSIFVQVACFKPIWCIWGFACTAPFVAFWPWTGLRSRMRMVAALCAVWAVIEGWFQLQQVFLGRNTWSNRVQDWMSLAIAALVIALFGYIFHQQRIAADERAEMRGELSAARQVQHLLIPDKMQVTPGVTVSSAFLPAHEVGGDFYLCRALANGAQRVLLGDVSGKGVAAALTSALLLGAADRCDDLRPAVVLKELNAALRNSGIEGFTTCLCADLTASGVLLIANAGQLAPYRNGQEIEIPVGLPLGVEAAASYAESSLQLAPGDSLTFLSDGVVEARNAVGELFGFERTRQLSSRAAQQIADAAVQFGQQDDITVLTLSLAPAPASA
ncbi:MAG: PP2C family protein-serine/threonine phosphatase [Terracidiphilus sp.]